MNSGEYEIMARVEETHWWYRGLRDVLERTLRRPTLGLPPNPRVLDVGCGTGRNLVALDELLAPSYLGGFDNSEEALDFARGKAPRADLWVGDICDPALRENKLDLVISMDVVYIPGAEAAKPGLKQIVDAMRPGGLMVLNLPAYNWLYSRHDVAIHTRERYTTGRVRSLLTDLGLEIEQLTYRLCLLFPLVVASRLPTLFRKPTGDQAAQSDLHSVPGNFTNGLLTTVLRAENALIARGMRFPFGSSVYAVARKRRATRSCL